MFEVGDFVTVKGKSFMYGVGHITKILDNCNKAVVKFRNGDVSYIPLNQLKLDDFQETLDKWDNFLFHAEY